MDSNASPQKTNDSQEQMKSFMNTIMKEEIKTIEQRTKSGYEFINKIKEFQSLIFRVFITNLEESGCNRKVAWMVVMERVVNDMISETLSMEKEAKVVDVTEPQLSGSQPKDENENK